MTKKSTRRKVIRYGLLALNVLILVGVGYFVLMSRLNAAGGKSAALSIVKKSNLASDPLDQLSSADIAVNVARMTNLPEATAVTNQADSENAELAISQASDSLVSKPQVVASVFKSNRDIQVYIVKDGDTVAKVARKFSITSNSIIWSNSLTGNTLTPGQKLYIPPMNGIVYVVRSGDTAGSLAAKFHTSKAKIIASNFAELSGLKVGMRIIIPDGKETTATSSSFSGGFGTAAWGSSPVYGYNGYDYGYCTWYVANQISVPANWGNASSWAYYAAQSGWTVSPTPTPGSIAQTAYAAGGLGHVAIVNAVSADGSMVKITDMNGVAGFGQVGTAWQPTSKYQNYISR